MEKGLGDMNKDQLIHEIGSKLVEDIGVRKVNWTHLVLVGIIEQDNPEMAGFVYMNGEHEPVAPRDFSILRLLEKLRKAMAAADKKEPWCSCLIRINRATGAIDFEFEYDKVDRWAINLKNSEQRASELSPLKGHRL